MIKKIAMNQRPFNFIDQFDFTELSRIITNKNIWNDIHKIH